ncbi:MAG TPA: hypothetical protein VK487_00015 [Candidatus Bathyarchaeia archaeon]|nr:hypothetical protein [Candidatus Bathyarchaeia archaeon]
MSLERKGDTSSVEIVAELAESARKNIKDARFDDRVRLVYGDGSIGYVEKAPYARILATAAAPKVPQPLFEQLSADGIIVLPVGGASLFQSLVRLRKFANSRTKKRIWEAWPSCR